MKLRDSEVRGYNQDADLKKELLDYKIRIGTSLVLNKYLFGPNLRTLYERRKTEYRVSHIFLRPDSTMNDAQVQELGAQLIKRIQNGEDFAKLAVEYSKDEYTKKNGGDVHYLTAGQVNSKVIENAIYGTEVNQIYPSLVKFQYGYSILKVTEKHPRINGIKVAHILTRFKSPGDSLEVRKKIEEVQQKLNEGVEFSKLAQEYSDDYNSSEMGGELGYIERNKTDFPFEQAAYSLKPGETSGIVKSPYGYHIIKMSGYAQERSFEEQEAQLKTIYSKSIYNDDYESLTEKLKKEMNYSLNMKIFDQILANADTTKINNSYNESNLHKLIGDSAIFSLNGKSVTTDSLFANMKKEASLKNKKVDSKILESGIKLYSQAKSIQEKVLVYDKEDPEFAKLIDDYENGMYLFKILDDEVWSKVQLDSAKVKNFYDQTKDNYKWKDRVEFSEIFCLKDSTINECYAKAVSGYDYDSVKVKFNKRVGADAKSGYTGLVEVAANELAKQADELKNIGDISKPFKFENGWSIVKLIKRVPPELKAFEEARAEASSILQEKESKRLEEAYIERLKNTYHPKVYYNELKNAFK
jgi:peptidyl-prolyl cis-trans isomerase SurA